MSQPTRPVVFILNDKPIAHIGASGKVEPTYVPQLRADQIDNRSDLGMQEWIEEKFGRHNPADGNQSIAG